MLKIVNQTTYAFAYELWDYATSTQIRLPGNRANVVYPNQIDAWQFDRMPNDKESALYLFINTYVWDNNSKGALIESVNLPASATVTFGTQVTTGLLPTR